MNNSNHIKKIQNVPVSSLLAVIIIVIFALYFTTAIKTIPCGKDVMSQFYSNFVHVKPWHLITNLFTLYALSRVEENIGSKKFFSLIAFSLVVNTLLEVGLHKIIKLPCSIGFSGVLFSVITWEMVTTKTFDLYLLLSIFAMVIIPSLQSKKVSLTGHLVGAISGVISGLLWTKLAPKFNLNGK